MKNILTKLLIGFILSATLYAQAPAQGGVTQPGAGGTITGVVAGSGLSGGGSTGAVTLNGTIACAGAPGNTTLTYRQSCSVTSTGALYVCNNSAGCTVAADVVAVGTAGAVTVVGAGNLTSTDCVTGGGSQTIQTPSVNCTVDSSGNVTVNSLAASSDGVHAGYVNLVGNTANPAIIANTVGLLGPASASFTAYAAQWPSVGPASSSVLCLAPLSGSVTALSFCDLGTGIATFLATPSSANLAAAITDETGTGALVFANTPTLVTPVLGAATATSINKVAITAPASSATLTIANGKTLTANNSLTLAGTDSTAMTFPGTSDTVVTLTATQTLTNKTLTSPVMTTPSLGVASATSVNLVATPATLTAQAANIAQTTIYATPAANHYYMICAEEFLTQAASGSSVFPYLSINYTSSTDNVSKGVGIGVNGGSTSNATFVGNTGCIMALVKASTNIQYSTSGYTSVGATPMQYGLNATVTLLQ